MKDKKKIAKLVEISYIDNVLNEERVLRIAKQLGRAELKNYLKALRLSEDKRTVFVESNFELSEQNKKSFVNLFADKRVKFRIEPNLLFGIRIIEDDMVYNLNMKSALDQISMYLNK